MPTYGYRCDNCGHEFEEFQLITAAPLKKCPECGKKKLIRLIGTGGAIIFKGSGFYITDYRSDSYQKAAKADSGSATPASSSESSGSSDGGSKPESKSTSGSAQAPESKPAKSDKKESPKKK